ncbi:ventral expressed homeobox [Clupea harengus]|uniref:Ventral expressed homeobox n=1 Tax=Clupea harengus TaxID=7950 RepID=A0A6P8GJZ8_CLUHA|nr:ventral expressed homeobox [Clupea harengus]
MRTKFTSDQIFRLEKTFNKHKYLGATQRRKIAEKLQLSETQVKTWFQNRRMKLKRDVQDMRAEYLAPSLLPSLLFPTAATFQHRGFSGQLLAFPSTAPHVYPHSMQSVPARQLQPQPPVVRPMMLASCYY